MSKNAVKRPKGGKRPKAPVPLVIQRKFDNAERVGATMGKIIEQEYMLMALKRMGILGPKRLQQLNDTLIEVRHDYCELLNYDMSPEGNNDADFEYTKYKFEEEMRQALGDENHVGWDLLMNPEFYTEGVRELQIKKALNNAVAEKMGKIQNSLQKLADNLNNAVQ